MFFCCGRSTPADDEPAAAAPQADRSLGSASTLAAPQAVSQFVEKQPISPHRESMSYERERRQKQDQELERTRSPIASADSAAAASIAPAPLTLSISSARANMEGGFLSPKSPRIEDTQKPAEEDDWARDLMETVSRTGSSNASNDGPVVK